MNVFKLHTWSTEPIPVTKEDFEKNAGKEEPYYVKNSKGIHCYGVCYYCNNPVQLNGLYTKNAERQFASHAGKSIPDLAEWDQEEYEFCPKSVKGKHISKEARHSELTDKGRLIYNTLRDHIPEAYVAIRKVFGLYISQKEFLTILEKYYYGEDYLYPYYTTGNTPYMLLYLAENQYAYKRMIRKDSPLAEKLKKSKDIKLVPVSYIGKDSRKHEIKNYVSIDTTHFLKLNLMIWNHRFSTDEAGNLDESVNIQLSKDVGNERESKYKTIAEIKIPVDENYFGRLINSRSADSIREKYKDLAEEGRKILKLLPEK